MNKNQVIVAGACAASAFFRPQQGQGIRQRFGQVKFTHAGPQNIILNFFP